MLQITNVETLQDYFEYPIDGSFSCFRVDKVSKVRLFLAQFFHLLHNLLCKAHKPYRLNYFNHNLHPVFKVQFKT